MTYKSLSGDNLNSKIYVGALFCGSLSAFGFAAFQLTDFSSQQFLVLGLALLVSAFANQHQIRIPGSSTYYSAAEILVFWGTLWLGVPGGVLLAASAPFARFRPAQKNRVQLLFGIVSNVCASFLSANIFYLTLHQFAGFSSVVVADGPVAWQWLAAAFGLMAVSHYLSSAIFKLGFIYFGDEDALEGLRRTNFSRMAVTYVLSGAAAFLVHNLFLEFGLPFGLVVLPIVAAGHFAYKFHTKRLERMTKEIVEASRIHLATVEVLATAIDARDQVGIGHVRRTQIYAVGMGELLGLSEDEIHALNTGALLHDIGKLAVPDHILNKPGRLTPAEMEKTKIHASVGASILEKVNFSYPVVPTVKYHHECWDGSGYPEGLKAQNIPLTARILSVADAYDTLLGVRPYRAAVSREEARKFLMNGAGTQFDPRIVDVFLRHLKKFETAVESENLSYTQDHHSDTGSGINFGGNDSRSYVEQIKSANREVFTLYELARIFSSSLNLEDTFSLFAEKIGALVPFDTCVIYLLDETGSEAKAVYTEGKNASALFDRSVKPGDGPTGFVLKKRQAVCKVNPDLDFSFCQLESVPEYSAMAALPLIADEKLLGAVSLYSCHLENYEDEHLRLLETVSRIASDAISKSIHQAETETRALTDPMTTLPNARSLQIQFEKEVARAERNDRRFQVLMLDLDGFKAVNDTFGHKTGDKLLRELSKVMRGQLRDYDFLSRYAGDEFVAIIPETDDLSIEDLCERIEKSVNDFVLPVGDGKFARVGISIGAASFPANGDTLDHMVSAADKAMYDVKALRKRLQASDLENLPEVRQQVLQELEITPKPMSLRPTVPTGVNNEDINIESNSECFVVEVDESHIISTAIN